MNIVVVEFLAIFQGNSSDFIASSEKETMIRACFINGEEREKFQLGERQREMNRNWGREGRWTDGGRGGGTNDVMAWSQRQ